MAKAKTSGTEWALVVAIALIVFGATTCGVVDAYTALKVAEIARECRTATP